MDTENVEEMVKNAQKKGLLMGLMVVLVLAIGLFFAGAFDAGPTAIAATSNPGVEGAVMEGGELVVNLADRRERRYAKIGFSIVLSDGVDPEIAKERLPLIKDAIMPTLMGKTSKDLQTPAGYEFVRATITEAARTSYPRGDVLRSVLTEFIVQ
jgi:flagellar basal body-associated protein FliL